MGNHHRSNDGRRLRRVAIVFAATALAGVLAATPVGTRTGENAVVEWNQIAIGASVTALQGPLPQLRSMAIVQLAMHDAVLAITGESETYLPVSPAPSNASAEAAAIAAAHLALSVLFPLQDFDDELADSLAARLLDPSDPGIAFGQSVATALLALRSMDGASTAQFPYTAPGAGTPGVWVGNSPTSAVLPGWGNVDPFVLQSGSQFRPDGPPALDSGRYARDYNEVKDYGSNASTTLRTAEQSNIARFWIVNAGELFNPLARDLIEANNLDLGDSARVLALMFVTGMDASIACWEAKYTYDFWRPTDAIRNGAADGNDETVADPTWTPFLGTPQFPEYVAGHTTISGAMAFTLTLLFGDDPGITLVGTSRTNPGFGREWATFSEMIDEVIDARIWGGFHFRTSDEVGARVGRQVARFVVLHALGLSNGHEPVGLLNLGRGARWY
jgi:hypothetical protein